MIYHLLTVLWMTNLTSGLSIPIPKARVATTACSLPSAQALKNQLALTCYSDNNHGKHL